VALFFKEKFWDYRPWTRIVEWKKAYSIAKDYVIQNHLEAMGLVPYKPRNYPKTKSTATKPFRSD